MKLSWCKVFANKFLKCKYDIDCDVPIYKDNKMEQLGKFVTIDAPNLLGAKSLSHIDLNLNKLESDPLLLMEVLMHELTHYALYLKDLPYEDDSFEFNNEWSKHKIL